MNFSIGNHRKDENLSLAILGEGVLIYVGYLVLLDISAMFVGTTTLGIALKCAKGMVLGTTVARNLKSVYWLPCKGRTIDRNSSLP